ncbi:undecaprenyldiphospho-muramoylpentapeptide beta-N-acetylglucosaminyltransferase [Aliiglaciecola litoralis]|uniref:UDP-N-acetylglucosamine--N-acetylmuramyl-(pentapeptide) pyrophosphoryl-undecaprenol N-acetylglucosamine transferase n=1 Tax=Aliiglaciecola litoralis TaxID=582857 RepID=A0ABP3WUX9_9ALTE
MSKTILIMAGGTGGHVFPGLAVANELVARGWTVHWLGTPTRMEAELVPKAGFEISFIDVVGVRGNGLMRLLKAPFQIIRAVRQASKVLNRIAPNVVLGMGGFASGPGGVAAWLKGVPLVVHEQNAVPGMTNKLLAKIANRVLLGFNTGFSQLQHTQEKYHWVGNPVRDDFAKIPAKIVHGAPTKILIVGGSLGAKALNDNVPKALAGIKEIEVRHQTGKGHAEAVQNAYQRCVDKDCHWQVMEFIDDMANAYDWADIVICRAGALTVAEVAMVGVTAIFVPLPHAVDDHQTKNAQALASHGAAYLLPQTELENGQLTTLLKHIIDNSAARIEMGQRARKLAKTDATEMVSNICENLGDLAA